MEREGAYFPKEDILNKAEKIFAPVRYVDDDGNVTTTYPFNPNGSVNGIAALCTPDGRHLAIMPHPERTFLNGTGHGCLKNGKRTQGIAVAQVISECKAVVRGEIIT